MYSLSSFLRRELVSLRLALLMIEAMALWHNAGMSSSLGVYVSCSNSLAFICVCIIRFGSLIGGVACVGFGSIFFVVFLSLVIRLSCLVSDLVMGG